MDTDMHTHIHTHMHTDIHTHMHTSRLIFTARLRAQFQMPPVRNHGLMWTQHFWIRTSVVDCCCTPPATPPVLPRQTMIGGRLPEWQTSKCISSVSFVRIESNCFSNTQEPETQKMMDQNFEIRILWFLRIFWNFQKGVARSLCDRSRPLWSRPN